MTRAELERQILADISLGKRIDVGAVARALGTEDLMVLQKFLAGVILRSGETDVRITVTGAP